MRKKKHIIKGWQAFRLTGSQIGNFIEMYENAGQQVVRYELNQKIHGDSVNFKLVIFTGDGN